MKTLQSCCILIFSFFTAITQENNVTGIVSSVIITHFIDKPPITSIYGDTFLNRLVKIDWKLGSESTFEIPVDLSWSKVDHCLIDKNLQHNDLSFFIDSFAADFSQIGIYVIENQDGIMTSYPSKRPCYTKSDNGFSSCDSLLINGAPYSRIFNFYFYSDLFKSKEGDSLIRIHYLCRKQENVDIIDYIWLNWMDVICSNKGQPKSIEASTQSNLEYILFQQENFFYNLIGNKIHSLAIQNYLGSNYYINGIDKYLKSFQGYILPDNGITLGVNTYDSTLSNVVLYCDTNRLYDNMIGHMNRSYGDTICSYTRKDILSRMGKHAFKEIATKNVSELQYRIDGRAFRFSFDVDSSSLNWIMLHKY